MKAIVSLQREDGTFADVGMNTRTLIKGSPRNIERKAREWSKGKRARLEWFGENIYCEPQRVTYVN